ncbi:MAG: rubredoxin [bacterium]
MRIYRCKMCDYVYDPDEGDMDSGVEPGILFDELPMGWVCPLCGADQDEFDRI